MSAATVAWGGSAGAEPTRPPAAARRPHLRLVPTADAVPAPRTRLSRRGRLAVTLLVTVVLVSVAVSVLSGTGSSALTVDHSTTVGVGQTLSEVAAEQLPRVRLSQAVAQIQLANDLNSTQVHAGQVLLIPALP